MIGLVFTLVGLTPAVALGEVDISKTMLCALTEAIECGYEAQCSYGPVDELNLPPFIRVDPRAKTLTEHNGSRKTVATSVTSKDGQLVLQGIENRAYSISITASTGRLSASTAGPDAGFVFFGACTNP
jgi:hypothetical protein